MFTTNLVIRAVNILLLVVLGTYLINTVLVQLDLPRWIAYPLYFWYGWKLADWYPIVPRRK